jgi:hypothetical protein
MAELRQDQAATSVEPALNIHDKISLQEGVQVVIDRVCEGSPPMPQRYAKKTYRYPGPKPKSKEAPVVMLADAVAASAQTLNDPGLTLIRK